MAGDLLGIEDFTAETEADLCLRNCTHLLRRIGTYLYQIIYTTNNFGVPEALKNKQKYAIIYLNIDMGPQEHVK